MKRRAVIRNLIVISGGITLIPSCLTKPGKASVALEHLDISAVQENLLAEIAATIIPPTDTPGAREVGAHLFVLKMLDDCYEKEDQQKFVQGLEQLENDTKKRLGKSFVNCTAEQKQQVLQGVENKEASYAADVYDFYKIMKERTIQAYLTSKYVVVNIQKYTLIPSVKYDGYYPIKNLNKAEDGEY